jgi:hypothetical protein
MSKWDDQGRRLWPPGPHHHHPAHRVTSNG